MRRRMSEAGVETGGAEPWSYLIVGGVQLATHSWMSDPRMTRDELIDYLTMLAGTRCAGSSRSAAHWRVPCGTASHSDRAAARALSFSFGDPRRNC